MLISELIVELQNIKNEIGNIPVVYFETEIGEFYEPIVSVQNIKTVFDGEGDQESFKEAGITGDFVLLIGGNNVSKVRWIVSNDLGSQSDIEQLTKELEHNDRVEYVPVSLEDVLTPSFKPDIPHDNIPTIFYGPVNFVSRMGQLGYKPGVYGTPDTFSYENLCKNIPCELLFNSPDDSSVVTANDVIEIYSKKENENIQMFFKPFRDDKSIIGSVKDIKDIISFCTLVIFGKIPDTDEHTKFIISTPHGIEKEYRLFIVNGKIITGSEYNPDKTNNSIPDNVLEFGNKIISLWKPEPFFVLDVVVSNNNCFVMEIQNFHSAGFYSSDIKEIIETVNSELERKT